MIIKFIERFRTGVYVSCNSQLTWSIATYGLIDNKPELYEVMNWRQTITCTDNDPAHLRIYTSPGVNVLSECRFLIVTTMTS